MLNIQQFRELVVRPTLEYIGLHSPAAEELIMGTVAQESRFTYLKQMGAGPALGLFQMEAVTHDDLWTNYLAYRAELGAKLKALASVRYITGNGVMARCLVGNLEYACAMARIHYLRRKADLDAVKPDDVDALAALWKLHYNTPKGKGTEDEFVNNYYLLVKGEKDHG